MGSTSSKLGSSSTCADVLAITNPDGTALENKTCIVTGATSGCGYATARAMARAKCHVIATYRSDAGLETLKQLAAEPGVGDNLVEPMFLNLSSLVSVREFAADFASKHEKLDFLILNAGLWHSRRHVTDDNLEETFGVNHVAGFLLTKLLYPTLARSAASARVVVVASALYEGAAIDFNNLQLESDYSGSKAYGQSKLANILFANELQRRIDIAAGVGERDANGHVGEMKVQVPVTAVSVHPGVVKTNVARDFGKAVTVLLHVVGGLFMKNVDQGAATSVFAATAPDLEGVGGVFLRDCGVHPLKPHARDRDVAKQLWEETEKIVGEEFIV